MLSTCNDNPLMSDCHSSIGEWTVLVVFWLQIEVTDVPFTHICSPAITTESLEHLSPSVVINGLQCCVAIWAQSSKLNMTIFVGANNGLENSFVRTWHEHSLSCRRSIWLLHQCTSLHSCRWYVGATNKKLYFHSQNQGHQGHAFMGNVQTLFIQTCRPWHSM